MVNYLPSDATTTITVISLEVGTALTIGAPASVVQGQPFLISGGLTRVDTGAVLPNETVVVSYNGTALGSTLTDIDGMYDITVVINEVGTFTLTADFEGAIRPGLTLGASRASARVGLAEPSMLPLLAALGIVAYIALKK